VNGVVQGLSAAALFGASAPLAKVLLPGCSPLVLAGLLYLFAAIALSIYAAVRPVAPREAPLQRADVLPLLGVVLLGEGLGPVLMLTGLERVSGLVGSLLLNLEAPFTMLLAVSLFGEHLARREATAALAIVLGAAVLGGGDAAGLSSTGLTADPVGVACLAGAGLCWGIDNNLCQRWSLRDPVAVVRVKTMAAGAGNFALAESSARRSRRLGSSAAQPSLGRSVTVSASYWTSKHSVHWGRRGRRPISPPRRFWARRCPSPCSGTGPASSRGRGRRSWCRRCDPASRTARPPVYA